MTPLTQLYLGLTLAVLILAAASAVLAVVWRRETRRIRREAFRHGLAAGRRDGFTLGQQIGTICGWWQAQQPEPTPAPRELETAS